ncbi:MAG: oligosaccharide flippase family protein [Balneolaceae bacterium]
MRKLVTRLPKSFQDVATLIFGNGFAALFPIVLAPLLTRLYTEQEFGIYTTFLAVVMLFASFSTGRFDLAILESRTKNVAIHLVILSTLLTICISLISLVIISSIQVLFPQLENISDLGYLVYLIPISILLISLVQITTHVLNREKMFKQMTTSKIIRTSFGSVLQVGYGYWKFSFYGLVLGKLIGDTMNVIYSVSIIVREKIFSNEKIHLNRIKYVANKYNKYFKINSLHSFLNVSTTSSIPLLLGFFFDNSVVGFYGLSFSVCFLPVTLISQAVFQIFSREFSIRLDDGKEIFTYFKSTVLRLILTSAPIFIVLILFGDILFETIFGVDWSTSGRFAQILAPYLFSTFVVSPFAFVALRLNKHAHIFRVELVNIFLRIGSITVGSIYYNEFIALAFFSFSGIAVNIYLIIWVFNQLKRK